MGTLVSPGVSVPVTDQSFYIPASAPTVPLFFIATEANKKSPTGEVADGTNEHGVVRTITSIGQSVQTYGIPSFRSDNSGLGGSVVQHHGDARNEYGLFALNQFLGIGNRAYVVRANIDLADKPKTFISAGIPQVDTISGVRVGTGSITNVSVPSAFKEPETFTIVAIGQQINETVMSFTVTGTLSGMIGIARAGTPFTHSALNITIEEDTSTNKVAFAVGDYFQFDTVYVPTTFTGAGNGVVYGIDVGSGAVEDEDFTITFTDATNFTVVGTDPTAGSISTVASTGTLGRQWVSSGNKLAFTILPGSIPFTTNSTFTIELKQVSVFNQLGSTDSQKRESIVAALQATINSNQEIRSEIFEYNLILCPGYHETVDEMLSLSDTLNNEAFVIADTPVEKNPEQVVNWAMTSQRKSSCSCAYYYPWGLASNLDGVDVVCAPSGIALKTFAYSDNNSYVWFAPAGVRRGVVSGISQVGYVTGTLGQATKFIEANLNQGQRDAMYEFTANGASKGLNPIVFFPGRGLIIWGQKTAAPAASARDRINVERLLCYIRRGLRKGGYPFVFEINDQITRDDLKFMIDGFLSDIMSLRGLYDFVSVVDESNNTPTRIDRNELWGDIGIKPAKVAEFVYLPVTLYTTGANMGKN